ncbi:hypothetical protein Acr_15g0019060 [Actinidia rufa]|uniref:Uncharacterized protein n=1 Tax=Actinidia rufa TaxID=165716 RepID=A0A7J0FZD8_9ERIC|nr:hypothetical protein Acr_15g0019060 [Actinidia rufa]
MGSNLCCFRPSSPKQRPREIIHSATGFNKPKKENNTEREGSLTLVDFLASPRRKSPQCVIKPLPMKTINLSSPELHTEFFTPTNNFCLPGDSEKLWKVNEEGADEVEFSGSSASGIGQSGKLKKRVSFKMTEEADIIVFYSPVGILEE